ncbi:STAS domain-containing protein [Streptomyces sp. HUAS MG91]|uniref:STAS domain-containing protein n=1 Tax=Streptomyces tabacisoli TaxID=3156398 RepID=A0AAU8IZW4_9ACTN
MKSAHVEVVLDLQERIAVVHLGGDVDMEDVPDTVDAFTTALHDTSTVGTLIDLSALDFADSALVNQLLATCSGHEVKRRPLMMCGPLMPVVRRVLEITGTDMILPLAVDRREAIEWLRSAGTV